MTYFKNATYSILITCLLLTGCNYFKTDKKKDDFYYYSRTWDLYRLPLIKPFEIYSADGGHSWMFKRSNKEDVIELAGIKDSVIVMYSPNAALPGKMSQAWFVLTSGGEEEKVFTSEIEYKGYLKSISIDSIKTYEVNEIFIDFDKNNRLPPEWPKN